MQQHFSWRMLARFWALTFTILALIAASAKATVATYADTSSDVVHISAAPQISQYLATVPKAWGEYRGGSAQSGLASEDLNGTLPFYHQSPVRRGAHCGARNSSPRKLQLKLQAEG